MEEMYLAAVKQLRTIVFEIDYVTGRRYCSSMFQECFGIDEIFDADFTQDERTRGIIYEDDIELYRTLFSAQHGERSVTCRFVHQDGSNHWYRVTLQYSCNESGELERVIGTMKDVSDEIRTSAALKYHHDYDSLTGAPNFEKFSEEVSRLFMWDNGHKHALVVFDVEQFKLINDLQGMRIGDLVLIHIADALKELVYEPNCYSRMHSDVFCICLMYETKGDIIRFIEKLKKKIETNQFEFEIRTSYGVYLPEDADDMPINLMCDRASLAKKSIKYNAMQFCAFFDEEYRNEILKNSQIEAEMEQALQNHQFLMYLQPKFNLENGKIVGAEVLTRWNHPRRGMIKPDDFIPLFEKNGFIIKLDEYMWEEACKAIQSWHKEGRQRFPVSVNVSRYHIHNHRIEKILKGLLTKYELTPQDLSLEITETMFFDNAEELYSLLKRLQEMGFRLEVDDFGAGYSSLNMLRNIPADVIKIDKSFLDDTLTSEKGKIVIRHTIAMAKELQLQIIAEGVETMEHVNFLRDSHCDVAQGFYFAKPMPLEEFNKLDF
jgi:diguanylate cyclase (GGDEF)-like protein